MSSVGVVATPFGDPVEEVPLTDPPLITAIAQVQFPPVASLAREDFIGPFQERIRGQYPFLEREEQTVGIELTSEGIRAQTGSTPVWRFRDRQREPVWNVSLAPSFVALDTVVYPSHAAFLHRLGDVLGALRDTVEPSACTRIGLRYVDRLEAGPDLSELVRPEMLGVVGADCGADAGLVHGLSDALFGSGDAMLHGRWGLLPPNAVLDSLYGTAVEGPSWVLDLDMYAEDVRSAFDVDGLVSMAERFAQSIYRFFLWTVRPELLRRCGGKA